MSSEHGSGPHITPLKTYFAVYGALLVLTVATVGVSEWIHLESRVSIIVAMCVAMVKATLVCLWFMHLKYDTKFNQLFFLAGPWFIAVFFAFTMFDLSSRGRLLDIEDNFVLRMDLAQAKEAQAKLDEAVAKGEVAAPAFDAAGAFKTNCGSCHGEAGDGKGPAGAALNPPPANFTDAAFWTSRDDATVTKAIKEGGMAVGKSAVMPPWGGSFSDAQIAEIVKYIKTFNASAAPAAPAEGAAPAAAPAEGAAPAAPAPEGAAHP